MAILDLTFDRRAELIHPNEGRIVTKRFAGMMKSAWWSLAAVCAVVIGICAYTAPLGKLESLDSNPADTYYNLLVQGFRAGHLSLNKEVPPGFARLADPYDPVANRPYRILPYRMSDLSYYRSKLYLYWGVTPALMLYWPFAVLTGRYLFDRPAVAIFCSIGILVSLGLLRALWRRYFADVSVVVGGVRRGARLGDRRASAVAAVRHLRSGD